MHTTSSWRTCTCDTCRARLRAYNRDYMRDLRAHPEPRLVDAIPTRECLAVLRSSGLTLARIAQMSGYSRHTLMSVSSGRTTRVRAVMAEDLASIPVEQVAA